MDHLVAGPYSTARVCGQPSKSRAREREVGIGPEPSGCCRFRRPPKAPRVDMNRRPTATHWWMTLLLAFALAYTAVMKGHVRVDLLTDRLPQRTQAIIDSFLSLIGCSLMSLITWQIALNMKRIMDTGLLIAQVDIPMWPFAGLLVVGFFVFTLVLLAQSLEYLLTAVSK